MNINRFPLLSHFSTPIQQSESSKLGMWLFLATEILLFGGLFVVYSIYRYLHPELFKLANVFLDVSLGTINTIVLLFSSLTVVLAIHAVKKDDRNMIIFNLILTIICASIFLYIKYLEYSHKIHAGLLPGLFFSNNIIHANDQIHIFFSIYFLMTGLHGIHVLIGIIIFIWLIFRVIRGDFHSKYYQPIELGGLYWHLVDIIWIFLFPLLYLIS
jgi:cytochrome c oxidase subunit 3